MAEPGFVQGAVTSNIWKNTWLIGNVEMDMILSQGIAKLLYQHGLSSIEYEQGGNLSGGEVLTLGHPKRLN